MMTEEGMMRKAARGESSIASASRLTPWGDTNQIQRSCRLLHWHSGLARA